MSEVRKFSIVKPTLATPFHIDFEWWRANDSNWRVVLRSMLCPEHQEAFSDLAEDQLVDWIDPETAEVRPVDGLQNILIEHCAKQPGFLDEHTALVDALFRLLLVNGNVPMSPEEMGARLKRPPDVILKTISGSRVYRGLRPIIV